MKREGGNIRSGRKRYQALQAERSETREEATARAQKAVDSPGEHLTDHKVACSHQGFGKAKFDSKNSVHRQLTSTLSSVIRGILHDCCRDAA